MDFNKKNIMIEWKTIPGASNYLISNTGEIMSLKFGKEKVLGKYKNGVTGYLQGNIRYDGENKPTTIYQHRLVADVFVENPKKCSTVNHKDLDKHNNNYWNLEWVSQKDNIHHYYKSMAKNKPREMKAVEVWSVGGDYLKTYPSVTQAAIDIGVSAATVYKSVTGVTTKHRTYIFKYKED